MDEREARMGLCALTHLGAPKLAALVEDEGAQWVWQTLRTQRDESMWSRRAQGIDTAAIVEATKSCGARFIIPGDEEWPSGIADLAMAQVGEQGGQPFGLWLKGVPLDEHPPGLAVVGARAASQYGQQVAFDLAADLGAEKMPIISGLAFGIDAAAHRGALSVGGPTVAVVASGVDQPYPASNATLATLIARRGTVVSEAPPGARPVRPAFLARNRIIAAITAGTVVVEAALRSGAKNTAAWASELGRVVMAVPGAVTSTMSQTPHRLIRDGQAVLVTDARDVRELLAPLGSVPEPAKRGADTPLDRLPAELKLLREAFDVDEEVQASTLARRTGLALPVCLAGLQRLSEDGWIEEGDHGGWMLPRGMRMTVA